MGTKIFSNCMVCLELDYSFPYKRKKELRSQITENDGIISYIVTNKASLKYTLKFKVDFLCKNFVFF